VVSDEEEGGSIEGYGDIELEAAHHFMLATESEAQRAKHANYHYACLYVYGYQ
jgi:hypothetical protein